MDTPLVPVPLRILLVEDNPHDALAFRRVFRTPQVPSVITHCLRAEEALAQLRADVGSFDLVVVDHTLPGKSGLELCHDIRTSEWSVPVVILTGTGTENLAVEALKAGVEDYLIKDPSEGYLKLLPVVLPEVVRKYGERMARRQAEEALRESEARFHLMVDTAPVMVWMATLDVRYVFVNQPWLDFTGRTMAQELGEGWTERIYPADLASCLATYRSAFEARQPFRMEYRLQRADDAYRWLLNTGVPRFTPEGDCVGYIGSCIDITDHKQAEEVLRKWGALFREGGWGMATVHPVDRPVQTLLQTPMSPLAIRHDKEETRVMALRDTGLLDSPPERAFDRLTELACRLLHAPVALVSLVDADRQFFKSSQGLPEPWASGRVTPSSHSFCRHVVAQNSPLVINDAREQPLVRDNFAVRDLGTVAYLGVPLVTPDKEVIGAFCVLDDTPRRWTEDDLLMLQELAELTMTEIAVRLFLRQREQAEEALRQQRDWLDVTLASIGDAVIATDTHGSITFINPAAERLTGWSAHAALGRPINAVFQVCHEHTKQPVESPVAQVLRDGASVGLANHTILLTRGGAELTIADSGAPIRGADGTLHGVVLVFRDITEQRQWENVLLRARKIESVGVLAGGIAHDFNNLLTGIMGNISLAKMFAGPLENVVTRLTEAEHACQRATALTQQLLTFAKGGAPVRETVAVAELLTESATFAARGSKVRVAFALAPDLWTGYADAGQISQVIHNVILNAVQAMPAGGHIHVAADNCLVRAGEVPTLSAGSYVKVVIHDDGCGIPAEVLPNIFDPYFTTREAGSGLGLATAYAIMTKHEGSITVTSEVGQGTTCVLYLPAAQHAPVHAAEEAPLPRMRGSGRVLIMDDEAMIREVLQVMLEHLGYTVDSARDGTEAVALYQRAQEAGQPYRLVILDVTVPGGMGGLETLRQLQAQDPQVTAVISSGYATDPVLAQYEAYGFRGVLTKPYTEPGLRAALGRMLRTKRA